MGDQEVIRTESDVGSGFFEDRAPEKPKSGDKTVGYKPPSGQKEWLQDLIEVRGFSATDVLTKVVGEYMELEARLSDLMPEISAFADAEDISPADPRIRKQDKFWLQKTIAVLVQRGLDASPKKSKR